jgi:hypothetical protein
MQEVNGVFCISCHQRWRIYRSCCGSCCHGFWR